MVCIICNGKGYIVEKEKELACPECQGRGEDVGFNGGKPPKLLSHECAEPPCPGAFVG
jgi:RecJ-like exonuclease